MALQTRSEFVFELGDGVQVEAASVPEPASMTLLLTDLAGAVARRRFRRSSRN